jgi:outer membrane protein OmpA-like peptidoglycan-associated protein
MPLPAIDKRVLVQIAFASGFAAAASHWAAAQAPPEACQARWRDLETAVKEHRLSAAMEANRKIQIGEGCNPLRVNAKALMLDLYRQEDGRLEKAGTPAEERLAALSTALVRYGRGDDWELRLKIADLRRQKADAAGKSAYAAVSQAYYDVLQAVEMASPTRPRPSPAELERVAMLAYQYQALSPTPVKGRGLFSRAMRHIFVSRTPVPLQFVYAKTELTELGLAEAERVVKELKAEHNPRIHLVGHTDPNGSHPYNDDLSWRRAEAIRQFLIERGYPADRITVDGRGKRDVETFRRRIVDAGRFSPQEIDQILRRVEIVWKQ